MPVVFDTPITTNDLSLDRVLAAGLPVALVFLNGPAAPSLYDEMERLARQYAGQMLLAKVDIQDNPSSTRRYGIARAPALVTLAQGQVLSRVENIRGPDLSGHVAFLLGKGPRPEPAASQIYEKDSQGQPGSHAAGSGVRPSRAAQSGPGKPVTVTDQTFEQEVIRSATPVLVDFWAPWCGPCRMTEPVLEKLAGEMGGRLKVAKVNVDENPFLAQRYDVRSIPTMMVVKHGQVIDRWMGALPEPALRGRVIPQVAG